MEQLPYFDLIFERLGAGDEEFARAFGHHVHWGVWDPPESCTGTVADFAAAAERLTLRVCEAADVQANQSLLDCGCGFGGTLASLNERLQGMRLVGLNIDERQLVRARQLHQARGDNSLEFVCADACQLPFPNGSFDRILAVECIFHFPSRARFFTEVSRVLKPGGRFALSDFVSSGTLTQAATVEDVARFERVYGVTTPVTPDQYREYAALAGLEVTLSEDVTPQVLPGFEIGAQLLEKSHPDGGFATRFMAESERLGDSLYMLWGFRKPA